MDIEINKKNGGIARLEGNLSCLLRQHVGLIVECNNAKKARLQEKTDFKNNLNLKKKVATLTKSNYFFLKENKEKDIQIDEERQKNAKKDIEINKKNGEIAKLEGNLNYLLRQHVG